MRRTVEIELGREAMAALVEEQQGLEEAMRSVQDLERKLRNLTNSGRITDKLR